MHSLRKIWGLLALATVATLAWAAVGHAGDDFKVEAGFKSLFNGKDLTGWYYKVKKGEKEALDGKTETSDKRFEVKDGILVVNPGKGIKDIFTTEEFDKDFVLKLGFRAAAKADSGVYIRGPQLQVRDYPTVGPYKKVKFKDADWNELEITVTGTAAECKCNGEVIEKAFKVPAKGGIGLQAETGKFEFRRVRIKVAAAEKAPAQESAEQPASDKHLLVITESKGFRHGCVARKVTLAKEADVKQFPKMDGLEAREVKKKDKEGKESVSLQVAFHGRLPGAKPLEIKSADGKLLATVYPCLVETTLTTMGGKSGMFDVVCSQDSRQEITAENLKKFNAVWFYTTGELPLSDTQKADLLSFVKNGGGFGGSHSATDTSYQWKEYGELIGGYFDGHPWTQKVKVVVEDTKHPATKHLGSSFEIDDEIYQFKGPFARDKQRVLMHLDMSSVKNPGKRKDLDNPLAWIKEVGKGRVFYTALGHRDEVWRDPRYEQHVLGALRYLFRLEDADATPLPAPTPPSKTGVKKD